MASSFEEALVEVIKQDLKKTFDEEKTFYNDAILEVAANFIMPVKIMYLTDIRILINYEGERLNATTNKRFSE